MKIVIWIQDGTMTGNAPTDLEIKDMFFLALAQHNDVQ
jgi:hypothetical protein